MDLMRMLAILSLLTFGCIGSLDMQPPAVRTGQLIGTWTTAPNEPAAYSVDMHAVNFAADGSYASIWRLTDGTTETTPGAWENTLDGVQVSTTERGTVTIWQGAETQAIDYIVDGPRLWLGTTLYAR
jgi:hypothetical protein